MDGFRVTAAGAGWKAALLRPHSKACGTPFARPRREASWSAERSSALAQDAKHARPVLFEGSCPTPPARRAGPLTKRCFGNSGRDARGTRRRGRRATPHISPRTKCSQPGAPTCSRLHGHDDAESRLQIGAPNQPLTRQRRGGGGPVARIYPQEWLDKN